MADPEIRELVGVVKDLVYKVDGLLCHFSSIDADYERIKGVLFEHERRLSRLERAHDFEPESKVGETSALFAAIQTPKKPVQQPNQQSEESQAPESNK